MTPSTTQTQTGASRRYQMLDVWRGAICLLVVLEHVGVVLWVGANESKGWERIVWQGIVGLLQLNIGTSLFFVISGYCIASSVDSARRKGEPASEFLLRRLWRIFPTYWAALVGFIATVMVLDALGQTRLRQSDLALELWSPASLSLSQWFGNLTLTETWRPMVGGGEELVFTRVAWSMCHQEQFYLICFLALWLSRGRVERFLGWATVGILAFRILATDAGMLFRFQGAFPFYWHEFAVGLAVYWRLNAGRVAAPAVRRTVEVGIAGVALYGALPGERSTVAAAAFGLILIAFHPWDEAAGRARWLAPLRSCGRRSFSIYLTHLPVVAVGNTLLFDLGLDSFAARVLVLMPAVTAATLAVGWAFHRGVECRFMGSPPRPRLPLVLALALPLRRPPAASVALPVTIPVPVTGPAPRPARAA